MAENRTSPLSVRLSPELNTRLEECADKLRMKKHSLAQEAIEAAVDAIEANNYRLVLPLEFDVTHVAAKKQSTRYPESSNETVAAVLNDKQSTANSIAEDDLDEEIISATEEDLGLKASASKKSAARQKAKPQP